MTDEENSTIKVTRTYTVSKCIDCPYCETTMDGPTCKKLEEKGAYSGLIFPEGREGIHPNCPFSEKPDFSGKATPCVNWVPGFWESLRQTVEKIDET